MHVGSLSEREWLATAVMALAVIAMLVALAG
jgi:hypothetical protein